MHKGWKIAMLFGLMIALLSPMQVVADSGYRVIIEDDADLLSQDEERQLEAIMEEITEYGGVAFKSIDRNDVSTGDFATYYYYSCFQEKSGVVFLIDMDNRNIWIE